MDTHFDTGMDTDAALTAFREARPTCWLNSSVCGVREPSIEQTETVHWLRRGAEIDKFNLIRSGDARVAKSRVGSDHD